MSAREESSEPVDTTGSPPPAPGGAPSSPAPPSFGQSSPSPADDSTPWDHPGDPLELQDFGPNPNAKREHQETPHLMSLGPPPFGPNTPWWAEPRNASTPAPPESPVEEDEDPPAASPGVLVAGYGVPSIDTRRAVPAQPIEDPPSPSFSDTDPDGIPVMTTRPDLADPTETRPDTDVVSPETALTPDAILPPGVTPTQAPPVPGPPHQPDEPQKPVEASAGQPKDTPQPPKQAKQATNAPWRPGAPQPPQAFNGTARPGDGAQRPQGPQGLQQGGNVPKGRGWQAQPLSPSEVAWQPVIAAENETAAIPGLDGPPPGGQGYRPEGGALPPMRPPPRGERNRRTLMIGGVVAAAVLIPAVVFVVWGAASGSPDSGERSADRPAASSKPASPPAGTPPAPTGVNIDTEATDREPLALTEAFPSVPELTMGSRFFTQDRTSVNHRCGLTARGAMVQALERGECRSVIRATYVNVRKTIAVTAGIAVMPTRKAAVTARQAGDPSGYEWFRGMPGRLSPNIDQAGGYASSTVRGRYLVYAYATYTDGTRPEAGDQTLKEVAGQFIDYGLRPIDKRASGT